MFYNYFKWVRLTQNDPLILNNIIMKNQTIAELLWKCFSAKLGPNFNTLNQYAADLGISSKKLQRLLSAENTTFSKELNNYRMHKTRELLKDTRMPLSAIANMLGYSSGEAFYKACIRWFGCSPSRLRKR